jgi:hypothetical protein
MRWHAEHGIPVEMNESHHWSLRDSPDSVAVVAAYLAAYNAREEALCGGTSVGRDALRVQAAERLRRASA